MPGLLRFTTAGSVDDGKSTLIGRLLHDSRTVYEDQLAGARRGFGSGAVLDLALLTDGLRAEREQGITIDVAYRYFSTARRSFILADTPGHEQYTRNMATGASTAEAAVILVDAGRGLQPQTRRHAALARLLGIRHVVAAINKMDMVGFSQEVYNRLAGEFRALARQLGWDDIYALPVSALLGDNIVAAGANTAWFAGPPLLRHLEELPLRTDASAEQPFRFPIQYVVRTAAGRALAGTIASGSVRVGEEVRVWPRATPARIARILVHPGEVEHAEAGAAVALVLDREVDAGRGDLLAAEAPKLSAHLRASLVWISDQPSNPGTEYWLRQGTRTVRARVTEIVHRLSLETMAKVPAQRFEANDIGEARVELASRLAFESYETSRALGAFILIDPDTNATAAAGVIRGAVEEA